MIKLIGAILVVAGTASVGLNAVMRLKGRVGSLGTLITALDVMHSEICTRLTPMPELLEKLTALSQYPVSLFFENCRKNMKNIENASFYRIWKLSVKETPELELTAEEEQAVGELGVMLGHYDVEEQSRAIIYTKRRVDAFLQKAVRERDTQSRMYAVLGLSSGLAVVIILI